MTEARAWMSSWSVRSVHCWRTGSGHMGATPQPKRTVASSDNQRRKFRKSGVSNVSESNQRSGESIDTVGVTGSIPVSPTTKPPDSGASSHVRIFLGPFSRARLSERLIDTGIAGLAVKVPPADLRVRERALASLK
jgi:hypothetical protein